MLYTENAVSARFRDLSIYINKNVGNYSITKYLEEKIIISKGL